MQVQPSLPSDHPACPSPADSSNDSCKLIYTSCQQAAHIQTGACKIFGTPTADLGIFSHVCTPQSGDYLRPPCPSRAKSRIQGSYKQKSPSEDATPIKPCILDFLPERLVSLPLGQQEDPPVPLFSPLPAISHIPHSSGPLSSRLPCTLNTCSTMPSLHISQKPQADLVGPLDAIGQSYSSCCMKPAGQHPQRAQHGTAAELAVDLPLHLELTLSQGTTPLPTPDLHLFTNCANLAAAQQQEVGLSILGL